MDLILVRVDLGPLATPADKDALLVIMTAHGYTPISTLNYQNRIYRFPEGNFVAKAAEPVSEIASRLKRDIQQTVSHDGVRVLAGLLADACRNARQQAPDYAVSSRLPARR